MKLNHTNRRISSAFQPFSTKGGRDGFTLLEILVVVAIIVMLAGMAVGVMSYLEGAREKAAVMNATAIRTAMIAHRMDSGNWPESLQVLVESKKINQETLLDPWNRPFEVAFPPEGLEDDLEVYTMRGAKKLGTKKN